MTRADSRTKMRPMTLSEQLRHCANTPRNAMNPFWEDEARRLMRWAADTVDAAEIALKENQNDPR